MKNGIVTANMLVAVSILIAQLLHLKKINPKTGETLEENPDLLRNGDVAEIVCEPTRPTCIEKNEDFPQLAKVAIRDMGRTVAAGICIDVVKK